MTKREAAIVSAYTGFLIGDFADMHEYVEQIMGGPVWTHQMGDRAFVEKIRAAAKADFIAMDVAAPKGEGQ